MGLFSVLLLVILGLGFLHVFGRAPGRDGNDYCSFDRRDSPGPWRR